MNMNINISFEDSKDILKKIIDDSDNLGDLLCGILFLYCINTKDKLHKDTCHIESGTKIQK